MLANTAKLHQADVCNDIEGSVTNMNRNMSIAAVLALAVWLPGGGDRVQAQEGADEEVSEVSEKSSEASEGRTFASPKGPVELLHETLITLMKGAENEPFDERTTMLKGRLPDIFAFQRMAAISIGRSAWQDLSADQRQAYTEQFRNYSAAAYASRFDGYNDHEFVIDEVKSQDGRAVVETRLLRPDGDPVELDYRLQASGEDGSWQILDVVYDGGVSELAQRRSQYASVLRNDGFDALINALEEATERQRPDEEQG